MTHDDLQRPRVHAAPCQGIASGVAKHMHVDGKFEASSPAKPFDELLCAIDGYRRPAFAEEEETAMLAVPNEP